MENTRLYEDRQHMAGRYNVFVVRYKFEVL